ncbi:MAG TPA: hypothetical protein VK540_33090 [Polyangiaceae bacterium]|nr:hypothetical protein [Polyangiaceae bacterium]
MVATRDIGTAAARLLAEGGSGKRVIELAGPREYSPRDVAAALARVVGKPITVQEAPPRSRMRHPRARGKSFDEWLFRKGALEATMKMRGRRKVSAREGLREAVLSGLGIAVVSEWL